MIDYSANVVYLREDEWLAVRKLFNVDVELRRETVVDDDGQNNVFLVPGIAALFCWSVVFLLQCIIVYK